ITSNNIANSNSTGFKQSRGEFGDVFAASAHGLSSNTIRACVRLQREAQQFPQGHVDPTGTSLDMALSCERFLTLSVRAGLSYSRAGNFGADREGYVVNPAGQRLQVFMPNASGDGFDTGRMGDLRLATGDAPPRATGHVSLGLNLPGNAAPPAMAPFSAS